MADLIAGATQLLRRYAMAAFLSYKAEEAQELFDAADALDAEHERLRALVERWQAAAEEPIAFGDGPEREMFALCADELEAVLDGAGATDA